MSLLYLCLPIQSLHESHGFSSKPRLAVGQPGKGLVIKEQRHFCAFNISLEFSFLVVSQLNQDLLEQLQVVSFSERQTLISKCENPAGILLRMNSK